jgi:hypothetical protein
MEIDLIQGKVHRMGDAKFSPGHDVESQFLFLKYASQSPVQDSFGGVNDQGLSIAPAKLILEFTAFLAKGGLIEKVQRCTIFVRHVNNIAATDNKMALLIYLSV